MLSGFPRKSHYQVLYKVPRRGEARRRLGVVRSTNMGWILALIALVLEVVFWAIGQLTGPALILFILLTLAVLVGTAPFAIPRLLGR
jgi:hypothetical protein